MFKLRIQWACSLHRRGVYQGSASAISVQISHQRSFSSLSLHTKKCCSLPEKRYQKDSRPHSKPCLLSNGKVLYILFLQLSPKGRCNGQLSALMPDSCAKQLTFLYPVSEACLTLDAGEGDEMGRRYWNGEVCRDDAAHNWQGRTPFNLVSLPLKKCLIC